MNFENLRSTRLSDASKKRKKTLRRIVNYEIGTEAVGIMIVSIAAEENGEVAAALAAVQSPMPTKQTDAKPKRIASAHTAPAMIVIGIETGIAQTAIVSATPATETPIAALETLTVGKMNVNAFTALVAIHAVAVTSWIMETLVAWPVGIADAGGRATLRA
jgi:hypothetical protein